MAEIRLFILDGMALAYRAYFAFVKNPITTSTGFETSAIYGWLNTLLELQKNHHPTHLAISFDISDQTFRKELFPQYKAQRPKMPEGLSACLPHIKEFCQAQNIPVFEKQGFEADDLIGSIANQAQSHFTGKNHHTFLVTPDKDFAQLVTPSVSLLKPGRKGAAHEILGENEVCQQWNIKKPSQVIDILALWGDSADNIPGVPSIGEKTAKSLISEWGSVQNLLENTNQLKGKIKENLKKFQEQALLSYQLATIDVQIPIEINWEKIAVQPPNHERLAHLFKKFELKNFEKTLF